jgi:hypothetical protein
MNYHVVLVTDLGPEYHDFPNREELQSFLTDLPGEGYAYLFKGQRLQLTQGPFRFLLEDGQEPLPLFAPPVPGPVVSDGCLEPPPDEPDPDYVRATQALK